MRRDENGSLIPREEQVPGCNPPKGIGLIATARPYCGLHGWEERDDRLQSPEGDWADCDKCWICY